MGVGVAVEELPYNYAYRRYPFGARRFPVYNPSFHGYWSDDHRGTFHDNSVYDGHPVPMFVVETPFKGDANSLDRKRKLDGLKGAEISRGGHNVVRDILLEKNGKNGLKASEGVVPFKSMHTPISSSSHHATTPAHLSQSFETTNPTNSKHPSPSSNVVKNVARRRVISIPVISTDEDKDKIIKCTVIPEEGTKKLRKAMSDEKAAVLLIQSWFRGYQVRRTAPLSQLRHIASIKAQLKDLDEKVSDANVIHNARENSLEKAKLTEGVMQLLLELDTIQNAHPDVRAVRKVVTKEVIGLQVRVDSLLSEMADMESSQLPMDIEEEGREETDREKLTATELHPDESVPAIPMDAVKEDESYVTNCAELDPDGEKNEVSTVEESPERIRFEAFKAEDEEWSNDSLSTQMVQSDADEGTTQDREKPITATELHSNDSVSEIDTAADEMEGIVPQRDHPTEGHIRNDISRKIESPSDSHHEEDGPNVEIRLVSVERTPEAAEVTTAEADPLRMNTNAERAGNVSGSFSQDRFQRNEEQEKRREELDDKRIESGQHNAANLSEPCDGLNAKSEDPTEESSSPRSPFEAVHLLDFQPSNSESELQSELQEYPGVIQNVSAQSEADNQALLLRLSEENKALKSLLLSVMKWNQMQATAMQDVNHRLGRLESRGGRKKSSSRRKAGKSSRMNF